MSSIFHTSHPRLAPAASASDDLMQRLEQLNSVGASLSAERDINRLLESILVAAKTITRADGKKQTTYKGLPLYYFSKDVKPGDTTGQGFKDLWSVAKP